MKSFKERVLQDDEDFLVELVDFNGLPAVKKSIKPTTAAERAWRLQNEAYGMEFMAGLAQDHPKLQLYIPKLYDIDQTRMLREYIDVGPVISPDMPGEQGLKNLDELARLLAGIDRVKPYGEVKFVGHFDYRNIRKNFLKWTKEPLAEGLITESQVKQTNQILDELDVYLEPRITHGDLSPHAHAYIMPDGKIALIDLENFTPAGARYYDVARTYVRLYSFEKSTDTPKRFLASFLKHAGQTEHRDEKLLAIMLQRTLGMQYDAWYDARKGIDYKSRAKELLELVLQGRVELLYS
ncbi:MAG: phosphotransferase [Candidatus Saccharimonadales bacterium]